MWKNITFGRLLVPVILACAFSNGAAAQVIVDDTFDVGAATFDDDRDDPFDVVWPGGFVADDGGLLVGNALVAGGDVFADFEPVTLESEGEFVRLSFDPHSASLTITLATVETTFDRDPTGPTEDVRLDGMVDDVSVSGVFPFFVGPIIDLVTLDHIYFDDRGPGFIVDNVKVEFSIDGAGQDVLQAGDADQDWDFDQVDLVKVQIAAKYRTGQAATWT